MTSNHDPGKERERENQMKKSFFKGIFNSDETRQERERQYLNQSVSIYDLERRQNEIARGLFR